MSPAHSPKDNTSEPEAGKHAARDFLAWQHALWSDEVLRKMATRSTNSRDPRATAVLVATVFGHWGRHCYPTAETVAEMLGCTERTVRAHLSELTSLGWFAARKRPHQSTVYDIAQPSSSNGKHAFRLSNENLSGEDGFTTLRDEKLIAMHSGGSGLVKFIRGVPHHLKLDDDGAIHGCWRCRALWNPRKDS